MQMRQCPQGGHYYDQSIYPHCPYCAVPNSAAAPSFEKGNTGAIVPQGSSDIGKTMPMQKHEEAQAAESKTVAMVQNTIGFDPVVGWLVIVEGKEKGRDYRILTDNNFLGRSDKMDICITGDDTISRENHATISYDSMDKIFYLSPGDSRSILRLNGKALFATAELNAYDTIEAGKTKLIFMPLCGDRFEWE